MYRRLDAQKRRYSVSHEVNIGAYICSVIFFDVNKFGVEATALELHGVTFADALQQLHVITAENQLKKGAAAFVECKSQVEM